MGDDAYEASFSGLFNDRKATANLVGALRDISDSKSDDEYPKDIREFARDATEKIEAEKQQ